MPTDKKAIDSYNQYAKNWAERMRSGQNSAHEFLEKPAMYNKLPDLKDKQVLCIGCGTGEECDHLSKLGAFVTGIDIASELIKLAKESFPSIDFIEMDMEKLDFPDNKFDFVYSSLVLHYSEVWTKTLKEIYRVMKKDGVFLFSTHHPVRWGAQTERSGENESVQLGYTSDKKTGDSFISGDYFTIRKIDDTWFGDFNVSFYHKPLSSIIREILNSGFLITDFLEPSATITAKEKDSRFWEIYSKIPLFMIFELKKAST